MLNSTSSTSSTAVALPWQDQSLPQRIAIVIERFRFIGDGTVTERNFEAEPETCDLSLAEIRANIGAARQLLDTPSVRPAYDRAGRVTLATALVLGMMPAIGTIHTTLREAGFGNHELGDLWDEIVARAADDFHADRAPLRPTGSPDIGQWARDFLSTNAN